MNKERPAIRQTAADYVAGDLDSRDQAEFERVAQSSVDLQREVEFWQHIQTAMKTDGRPQAHTPGAGFNEVLRRRINQTTSFTPQPSRFARMLPALSAGLAALLLVVVGFDLFKRDQARPVAWSDTGEAVYLPAVKRNDVMKPLTHVAGVSAEGGVTYVAAERSWLGLWSQPVELEGFDNQQSAALVVRVVNESPADHAGIRPGDVVLAIDGQAVTGPESLTRAVAYHKPGKTCKLRIYHAQGNQGIEDIETILGAVSD